MKPSIRRYLLSLLLISSFAGAQDGYKTAAPNIDFETIESFKKNERKFVDDFKPFITMTPEDPRVSKQLKETIEALSVNGKKGDYSANKNTDRIVYLFLSFSMSDSDLVKAYTLLDQHKKTAVGVFIGLPKDREAEKPETDLTKGILRIQEIAKREKLQPNLILDPSVFEEFAIKQVPALVMTYKKKLTTQEEKRKAIITSYGSYNPELVMNAFKKGEKGNIGKFGETAAIEEQNLIEVFKNAASKLDFKKILANAKSRALDTIDTVSSDDFSKAYEDKEFIVNLDYKLPYDITANGKVLAKKGSIVNPLNTRSFGSKLVFIDPDDEKQIAFAQQQSKNSTKDVIVLLSKIPSGKSQEDRIRKINWIAQKTSRRTHLITPDLSDRFGLKKFPATVEQKGRNIVRVEFDSEKL